MLGWPEILRAAAILALIVVVVTALVATNRRTFAPVAESAPAAVSSATDDLSAELHRCSALGPQDAEDAHCIAVWEENRRRFFGRPARPLPPTPPGAVAPATTPSGDAR